MEYFFYIYLFIIGTFFGSFSSVIIDRLKNKKKGIFTGRSECPKCSHKLGILDLIPIFSFLKNKGECKYCKEKISFLYLILEILTGFLFLLVGYFLIDFNLILSFDIVEIYKLTFFLLFSFLTIVYVFYDVLYLEIPDSILIILIGITYITIFLQSTIANFKILNTLPVFYNNFEDVYLLMFLGIIIISSFYFIMLKGLSEFHDFIIIFIMGFFLFFVKYYLNIDIENFAVGNAVLGAFFVFVFLFLQIVVSSGAGMGGGDLRIGILLGLVCGFNFSFYAILLTYFFGSVIGIIIVIYAKNKKTYKMQKKYLNSIKGILPQKNKTFFASQVQIPFGPFLAIGIYLILFFGEYFKDLIENLW